MEPYIQYTAVYNKTTIVNYVGDAQTLAVTKDGTVYSWGDGDYGKLGRGGSDGSGTPRIVEKLTDQGVVQVAFP